MSLYGLVTAIGGIATLRRTGKVEIPRIQVAVFIVTVIAVIVVSIFSIFRSLDMLWLVLVSLASLVSRVWNGLAMGRVHATHIVFFGSVMVLGIVLTQI